jgi:hypothetical protein
MQVGMPSPVVALAQTVLQSLQKHFALIDLSGEIRIIDRVQVKQVMNGTRIGEIAFYKKDGRKRAPEATPGGTSGRQ